VVAALFVAGGDAAELLEPVDEPLDALAGAVRRAVEVRVAPLAFLVGMPRWRSVLRTWG
jgi:hypothetical protein